MLYICGNSTGDAGKTARKRARRAQLPFRILRARNEPAKGWPVLFASGCLVSQPPIGEIRGTVVDDLKAVPLHAATIELRGEGIRRIVQAGETGYRVTGLPAGVLPPPTITGSFLVPTTIRSVHLQAGEVRSLPPVETSSDIIGCGRRRPAFLRPLDRAEAARGALAGTIVDDHGRPLPGTRVRVGIIATSITDDEGRFSIADVPARDRYEIEVGHDGYYTEESTDFRVQAGLRSGLQPRVSGSLRKRPMCPRPAPDSSFAEM